MDYSNKTLIKPLLDIYRGDIEDYCNKHNLNPKIDTTNKENIYVRNKVRNKLIPFIEENFEFNINTSINRLSKIMKEETEYFEKLLGNNYKEILIEENSEEIQIDLKKFNSLDMIIKNKMILYIIKKMFGTSKDIEKIHIEDIIKLINNNIGNKYLIPNKKIKIFVNKGKIFFIANLV